MSEYRSGAENIPLPRFNNAPMPTLVLVYDLTKPDDAEALVSEKRIDYSNFEDRKWLGRITFWALENNCSVETMALKDVDKDD